MEEKSLYLHSLVYLQRMASILYQKIDAKNTKKLKESWSTQVPWQLLERRRKKKDIYRQTMTEDK